MMYLDQKSFQKEDIRGDRVLSNTSTNHQSMESHSSNSLEDQEKKSKKLKGIEVFVGDISFFCKEVDLYKLFSTYGRVLRTRIKRSDKNGRTLMYGFVDMEYLDDANRCIEALHGSRFQGRDIRVELSGSRAPTQPFRTKHEDYHQIYISFKSEEGNPDGNQLPTETMLRDVFEQYSPVKDIAIKEYSYDKTTHIQQGFCFVAFFSLADAKRVFNTIHGHFHNGFYFACSLSYHFPLNDLDTSTPLDYPDPVVGESGRKSSNDGVQSPQHRVKSQIPNDPPVMMIPSTYVPYGGGMMPIGSMNEVLYPSMHIMPPVFPIPTHQVTADGTYLPVTVAMVPPPPSTSYPPSPSLSHDLYTSSSRLSYYPTSGAHIPSPNGSVFGVHQNSLYPTTASQTPTLIFGHDPNNYSNAGRFANSTPHNGTMLRGEDNETLRQGRNRSAGNNRTDYTSYNNEHHGQNRIHYVSNNVSLQPSSTQQYKQQALHYPLPSDYYGQPILHNVSQPYFISSQNSQQVNHLSHAAGFQGV